MTSRTSTTSCAIDVSAVVYASSARRARSLLSYVDLSGHEYRMVDGRVLRRIELQYKVQFGHRRGVLLFLAIVVTTQPSPILFK